MLFRADRLRSEQQLMARIEDLDARARSAYLELSRHYWQRGRLPAEDRDLAAVCKVSVVTFRHMRVQLGWAFDEVDAENRWRDHELEADREAAIRALGRDPADFQPQHDPTHAPRPGDASPDRTPRSAVNRANAVSGWEKRKAQAEAHRPDHPDARAPMQMASELMQNGMQNRIDPNANVTLDRMDFASSHLAPNAEEEEEDLRKSSSSSSQTLDGVRALDANGHANSHPVSHPLDAKSDASRGPDIQTTQRVMSNRELRDVLLRAIGDNVEPACRDPHSVKPIRELMRESCDLDRHILPELHLLAKSSKRLQTWRASWLHQQIRDRRDASQDEPAETSGAVPVTKKCFVQKGTPMWDAWMAYRLKVDGKPFTLSYKRGSKEGWDFDAAWPPGYEPARAAAE